MLTNQVAPFNIARILIKLINFLMNNYEDEQIRIMNDGLVLCLAVFMRPLL